MVAVSNVAKKISNNLSSISNYSLSLKSNNSGNVFDSKHELDEAKVTKNLRKTYSLADEKSNLHYPYCYICINVYVFINVFVTFKLIDVLYVVI